MDVSGFRMCTGTGGGSSSVTDCLLVTNKGMLRVLLCNIMALFGRTVAVGLRG